MAEMIWMHQAAPQQIHANQHERRTVRERPDNSFNKNHRTAGVKHKKFLRENILRHSIAMHKKLRHDQVVGKVFSIACGSVNNAPAVLNHLIGVG